MDESPVERDERHRASTCLNPHYHVLVLDGVYTRSTPDSSPRFHALERPTEEELARLVVRIESRVLGYLRRQGVQVSSEDDDYEPLCDDRSTLALCYAARVAGSIALGPESASVK